MTMTMKMKMSKSLSLLAAATPAVLLAAPAGAQQNQFLRSKVHRQVGAGLARGLEGMSMSMPTPLEADADALELSAAAYAAKDVAQALDAVLPSEVQACVGKLDFEQIVESIVADAAEAFQTLTEDEGPTASEEDEGLDELAEELSDAVGEFMQAVASRENGMADIVEAVAMVVQGGTPSEEEDNAVAVVLKDVTNRINEAITTSLDVVGCLRDIDVAEMFRGSASDFDWDEASADLGKARASILDAIIPEPI